MSGWRTKEAEAWLAEHQRKVRQFADRDTTVSLSDIRAKNADSSRPCALQISEPVASHEAPDVRQSGGNVSAARSKPDFPSLSGEQLLQAECVAAVRPLLEAVGGQCITLNGEIPGGGRLAVARQQTRKAMGYLPGTWEVLCTWPHRQLGWAEIKTESGRLSPDQEDFAEMLGRCGWPWAVWRGPDEAVETVRRWLAS